MARLAQRFFRRAVLASYRAQCCVSDIHLPALLVASHIVLRGEGDCKLRIAKCKLKIGRRGVAARVISGDLKLALSNQVLAESFQAYEGQVMRLPDKFRPLPEFLARHRGEVFFG